MAETKGGYQSIEDQPLDHQYMDLEAQTPENGYRAEDQHCLHEFEYCGPFFGHVRPLLQRRCPIPASALFCAGVSLD